MTSPLHARLRRASRPVLTLLTALAVLVLAPAGTAYAVSGGGPSPFALSPAPLQGKPRAYFVLGAKPGSVRSDSVIIRNLGNSTETLKLSAATGATSQNSGTTFTGAFEPCRGTGCWVTGLPSTVTLGAGESRTIPFTISVPASAEARQYLAGIVAQPAQPPAPVPVNSSGAGRAQAIIINQVGVGVVVSVGDAATSAPHLSITDVVGTRFANTLSRLSVTVRNDGPRFARGSGQAVCTKDGKTQTYPVSLSTIVPDDQASVPVNAAGLSGQLTCTVHLDYGGQTTANWSGTIKIPTGQQVRRAEVGPGQYAVVPTSSLPGWVIGALSGAGALILALGGALVLVMVRRRSAARHEETPDQVKAASR